ncbi:hypothetical protein ACU5AX_20075 [Sphingomonas sp. XXL09]|jgi:hypothetical protein|uniref:hypothetical protein n=1 Tax=Sphingomonas TaxID=13687 RepID=UPI001F578D49|nr:hypothetical protein [Sphingomonas sp. JXJ CY 53]
MIDQQRILTVRLSGADWDLLGKLADRQGYTRAQAARSAIAMGIRFADAGHTFNVTRAVLLLEYMQAAIDVIITRDHGDVVGELLEAAKQRLATYHA